MEFDQRSLQVLTLLSRSAFVNSKEICERFTLSRNQLDYILRKINQTLETEGLPLITRSKKGIFQMDPRVQVLFAPDEPKSELKLDPFFLQDEERLRILILMIFTNDELSLYHLTETLGVSKNTVIADIKKANAFLQEDHITIRYSRKHGYLLKGEEDLVRRRTIHLVDELLHFIYGQELLLHFLAIDPQEVQTFQQRLLLLENRLSISFTDQELKIAPFVISLLLKRIQNGHLINQDFGITLQDLSDTREYHELVILLGEATDRHPLVIPDSERLYITLFVLSLKQTSINQSFSVNTLALRSALETFVHTFERTAAIRFKDRRRLVDSLFVHMKTAYYRIKYQLTTDYQIIQTLEQEISSVYYLVEKSILPLEQFFQTTIPKEELIFIAMFISANLINERSTPRSKSEINAIIVCPNGIIKSKLIENRLAEWFPNINFEMVLSVREFNSLESTDEFDLIFSTTPLDEVSKKTIVVGDEIEEMVPSRIAYEVANLIKTDNHVTSQVTEIMQVIQSNFSLDAEKEKEIAEKISMICFAHRRNEQEETGPALKLADFIQEDAIELIFEEQTTWMQALTIGTNNLLRRGIVSSEYLVSLKKQYPEVTPGIILGRSILIPHTFPENGALKSGMSFVRCSTGINENLGTFKYIVVISAADKKTHIPAMRQLLRLSTNQEALQQIDSAKDPSEIIQLLQALD